MTVDLYTGPTDDPRRYRVETADGRPVAEPGSGGDGLVYRARSTHDSPDGSERDVALKLKLHAPVLSATDLERGLGLLRHLDDPHLMRTIDVFHGRALNAGEPSEPDDELVWIAHEWVEGPTLSMQRPTTEQALPIVSQVARAVHAMHRISISDAPNGFAHRDLKAANVKVTPEGSVVIIDYGSTSPVGVPWVTNATPGWIAPEVAAGGEPGKPADCWAVGAIAHHAITRRVPPLDGAGPAQARLHQALVDAVVPHADAIAAHLAALLEFDPDRRPTDLGAWADELDRIVAGKRAPRSRPTRTQVILAAVAALIVIAAVAAVVTIGGPGGSGRAQSTAERATTTTDPTTERVGNASVSWGRAEGGDVELRMPGTRLQLTAAEYQSYITLAGVPNAELAVRFGGYPTTVRHEGTPNRVSIELSLGGALIGPRPDAPLFWLPQQLRAYWDQEGGIGGRLGFPVDAPRLSTGTLTLDFQHGTVVIGLVGGTDGAERADADITVEHHDDPAALLAPAGDLRRHLIHQTGGTRWYVDAALRRHWVPDDATWSCLTGRHPEVDEALPGAAVFTLGLASPARCH